MQRIIKYYEKKFGQIGNFIAYTLPALNRAQQALGRVIRTEPDRGFLVLCERRYLENMKSLPSWMGKEAERCVADEFTGMVQDWKFSVGE
jgi:DNA excision repair protein ERCC-2